MNVRMIANKAEELRLSDQDIANYKTNDAIVKYRKKIKDIDKKLSRLSEIAKHRAEENIPVILQILINIKELLAPLIINLPNDNNGAPSKLQNTLTIVENAIVIFGETDKVQKKALAKKHAYIKNLLKEAKDNQVNPFAELETLVMNVKELQMTENTCDLWEELSIWMEGLYKHNANGIPERDSNNEPIKDKATGKYPYCDLEDRALDFAVGIRKMDISIYYHRASVGLDSIIEIFRKPKPVAAPAHVATASTSPLNVRPIQQASQPALEVRVPDIMEAVPIEGSINYRMQVLPESHNGFVTLQVAIPEMYEEHGQLICDLIRDACVNPLAFKLKNDVRSCEDSRINNLESWLTQFGLSESQRISMKNFKEEVKEELNFYLADLSRLNPISWLGRNNVPLVGGLFDKSNSDFARNTINELNDTTDVKEHILSVINLRRKLRGTKSTNLRPQMTKQLLNVIERICCDASPLTAPLQREASSADLRAAPGSKLA